MTKNKLTWIGLCLLLLIISTTGCDLLFNSNQTKSSSGSGSGGTSPTQPPHGQVTYNILDKSPFNGQQLNSSFWSNLEDYCKAGPTRLIIADMDFIPIKMRQAGFDSYNDNQLYYVLATTYAGLNWSPGDDSSWALWYAQDQIYAWWNRYIQRIVQIMQNAPQTTAIIIINDGPDRLGARLGPAIYDHMGSVITRVQMGDVTP